MAVLSGDRRSASGNVRPTVTGIGSVSKYGGVMLRTRMPRSKGDRRLALRFHNTSQHSDAHWRKCVAEAAEIVPGNPVARSSNLGRSRPCGCRGAQWQSWSGQVFEQMLLHRLVQKIELLTSF